MHIEIQVALNFVISYLYNKLPRRRVNLFGEELERALREKFNGHWYPDKPVRGSAYRCIKTGTGPVDPVLERAARESGIPVQDILENMPQELAVWVDPAEVSYRIGEKGAVRILYSEANGNLGGGGGAIGGGNNNSTTPTQISSEDDLDTEVRKTFNPDAQCFRPIQNALGNLNLGPSTKSNNGCISPYQSSSVLSAGSPPPTVQTTLSVASQAPAVSSQKVSTATVAPSVQSTVSAPGSVSPIPQTSTTSATATAPFLARPTAPPLTFTTATFAQTKFGSTKLKTSSKRANRMSPTEFSNYIKQRALQQQQQQQQQAQQNGFVGSRPRSLSPHPPAQPNQNGLPPQAGNPENYFFPGRHYLHFPAPQYHHQPHPLHSDMHFAQQQQQQQHKFPAYLDSQSHFYPSSLNNANSSSSNNSTILPAAMSPTSSTAPATSPGTTGSPAGTASSSQDGKQQLLDGLNFGLQTYQSGQYQHLLVAN